LFLGSSFYGVGAKLSDMQIFNGSHLDLSVNVYAPKPTHDAWHIDGVVNDQGAFTLGSKVKITLTLNERITLANVASNKIVIAGKEFLLTGTNGTTTKTLEFVYTVQLNDKIDTSFYINKKDIVLTGIQDTDGNNIDLGNTNGIDISPSIQNLALNSKGLTTISTNITRWHANNTAANIQRMTDGNTSTRGALNYATHPANAHGKHILFDFKGVNYNNGSFKLYNRKNVADRINGSTVEFLKDGIVVSIRTISDAGNIIEIAPDAHIIFDQVKLTFDGDLQNFREVEIFGKNASLSIDAGAPTPLKNHAWRINRDIAGNDGTFAIGDKIKVTLRLDDIVILAKVDSNKITIANKEFFLTGNNGDTTDTLEFTYTVQANDSISATDFNISSKEDINVLWHN
jgi:hypothetical protein